MLSSPVAYLQDSHLAGSLRPIPRLDDVVGKLVSSFHRVNPVPPSVKSGNLKRMSDMALRFCQLFLQPVDSLMDKDDYYDHLVTTKGKRWADEQLCMHRERLSDFGEGWNQTRVAGTFTKWESYEEYKHLRHIQSMSPKFSKRFDTFFLGRLVKTIERAVYKGPCNVKGLNKEEKFKLLSSLGELLAISDYSSYESSHTPEVVEAVFRPIYSHVLQFLPGCELFVDFLMLVLKGDKQMELKTKELFAVISSVEFSGDFTTALNNLMLNVIVMLCIYDDHGVDIEQAVHMFVCEGDDNVMNWPGFELTPTDYANYGLNAKYVVGGLQLFESDFCQLIYTQGGVVLADPVKKMTSSCVLHPKYGKSSPAMRKSLMRAQGMSMLYNHCGCPILHHWALALLRLTKGVNIRNSAWFSLSYKDDATTIKEMDWREKSQKPITDNARFLFELRFGVPVAVQRRCESLIDAWQGGPIHLPILIPDINRDSYYSDLDCPEFEDYEVDTVSRRLYNDWAKEVLKWSNQ